MGDWRIVALVTCDVSWMFSGRGSRPSRFAGDTCGCLQTCTESVGSDFY